MFDHYSDHLQGARMFLVKVTAVKHTSPHRTQSSIPLHTERSPAYLSTQNARTHTKHYAAASPHLTFYILNIFLNSVTLTRNIRAP